MKDKLYKMMNWPEIEGIIYAEESHPEKVLGCHQISGGLLFQMFYPGAASVSLIIEGDDCGYEMEMADEEGFFAFFLPQKEKPKYYYEVTDNEGIKKKIRDSYAYEALMSDFPVSKWNHGICYDAYSYLGAHFTNIDGEDGVCFAVWAPNAIRVSVVGDFNDWNGKCYQMVKQEESGIFALFVPGINNASNYKYEIRIKGGITFLKADPYAFTMQQYPDTASVLTKEAKMKWTDREWMKKREKFNVEKSPLSIYECCLSKLTNQDGSFIGFSGAFEELSEHIKKTGYTHIELTPVMESYLDGHHDYCTSSFFALSTLLGSGKELKEFINKMHGENIGVILDWSPAGFMDIEHGLSYYDGTCLYGHLDERMRKNVFLDANNFNYGRPQVTDFLLSNMLYWINEYHADGIRIEGLSSMLYLDYGKQDGEWAANIYGGNENLDAIEFIKHANSILHKNCKGVISIAKETSAWPKITESLEEEGLGFDYAWNTGFVQDYLAFISQTSSERIKNLSNLTLSMVYAYSENYILPFSHDDVLKCGNDFMSGDIDTGNAQLRATLAYQMCHPGKKMLYMGQDQPIMEKLNQMYLKLPALTVYDNKAKGFEWIHNINYMDGVICFARKGEYLEDTLLVVCNFSDTSYSSYKIGAPYEGKYKEILNSSQKEFGGTVSLSSRYKVTKEEEYDGRINSLTLSLAPLSVSIYSFKPYTQEELLEIAEKKAQKIREKLEKEAILKANALKKMSLRDTLEQKINEADQIILTGNEVQKEMKVIKKSRS